MTSVDPSDPTPPHSESLLVELARQLELSAGGRSPAPLREGWIKVLAHAPSLALAPAAPTRVRHARTALDPRLGPRRWIVPTIASAAIGMAILVVSVMTARRGPSPSTHTYTTAAGQQATVALSNGSWAVLGPATTLVVTTTPSPARTIAAVTGEALFTVVHHPNASFTVRTRHADATVLGTTFMVQRYSADHATRVVVVDGRVGVRATNHHHPHREVILSANTLGVVDDSGQVHFTPSVATEEYTAWSTGQLVFHDTPVPEVVAMLSRAYGVPIQVTDSAFAQEKVTWTVPFLRGSLGGVLNALTITLRAHIVHAGKTILIAPGRAAEPKSVIPTPSLSQESSYGR